MSSPDPSTIPENAYADDSVLTLLLGDNPKVKILAALLSESNRDLNITDIARLAGVSRKTVYEHLDDLQDLEVVVHTRDVGGSKMYQINRESPVAEHLAEIEWELLDVVDEE